MERFTQKQIRSFGGSDEFYARLHQWQTENNTTGLPSAYSLGLECVGYSAGVYGCNGSLFRDIETNRLYGCADRGYHIYVR